MTDLKDENEFLKKRLREWEHGLHSGRTFVVGDSEAERYRARKDEALTERNRLVALLAGIVLATGGKAGLREHEDVPGEDWDPAWRTLVCIDLPTGQVSWHIHDRDVGLVAGLPAYEGKWDGHDTQEKYLRVERLKEKLLRDV